MQIKNQDYPIKVIFGQSLIHLVFISFMNPSLGSMLTPQQIEVNLKKKKTWIFKGFKRKMRRMQKYLSSWIFALTPLLNLQSSQFYSPWVYLDTVFCGIQWAWTTFCAWCSRSRTQVVTCGAKVKNIPKIKNQNYRIYPPLLQLFYGIYNRVPVCQSGILHRFHTFPFLSWPISLPKSQFLTAPFSPNHL